MIHELVSETVQEKAYQMIRGSIVRNELLPGDSLSIDELSRKLGVSQTPIREALSRLGAEGLVERPPNRTAIVSSIALEDIHQAYEMRKLLEPHAARQIAASVETHPEIQAALRTIKSSADMIFNALPDATESLAPSHYAACQEIDLRLQELMVSALGDTLFGRVLALVGNYSLRMRSLSVLGLHSQDLETLRSILADHLAIIDALLAGDVREAVQTISVHLLSAEERTVDASRRAEGVPGE